MGPDTNVRNPRVHSDRSLYLQRYSRQLLVVQREVAGEQQWKVVVEGAVLPRKEEEEEKPTCPEGQQQ